MYTVVHEAILPFNGKMIVPVKKAFGKRHAQNAVQLFRKINVGVTINSKEEINLTAVVTQSFC